MFPSQSPEYVRAYRAEYRKKNRERYNAYAEEWRKRNLHKKREWVNRRNARKRKAAVEKVDYAEILKRDGCFCYLCLRPVRKGRLQYDHIIPISKGGVHSIKNIAVSHTRCNNEKRDKFPSEMNARMRSRVQKKMEEIGG